jgi:hypothetical protein
MPGPDGRGVPPTSEGRGGEPNPIWATSTPAGSLALSPVCTRAFVKYAGTTKQNQVRAKTQHTKQLNKAKTDSKPSPRCRGSGTAPEVPTSIRYAVAQNPTLQNGASECASASSLDTSSTGTSVVRRRLALLTSRQKESVRLCLHQCPRPPIWTSHHQGRRA